MEKVNRKPVLYAAIIALTLLLSKKAHASRHIPGSMKGGQKWNYTLTEHLVASAPKEKADMGSLIFGKIRKGV